MVKEVQPLKPTPIPAPETADSELTPVSEFPASSEPVPASPPVSEEESLPNPAASLPPIFPPLSPPPPASPIIVPPAISSGPVLKPDVLTFTSSQGGVILESPALQKPLRLTTGASLKASIKPSKPTKTIRVMIIFKKARESGYLNNNCFRLAFVSPALAQTPGENQSAPESGWQVVEYDLTDLDGDGVFEGEINLPEATGEYVIKTVFYYQDGLVENIEIETLIDPLGYVYQIVADKELRISQAKISLFRFNPEKDKFELWPAQDYNQENSQITGKTGEYSFLVPEGKYYLTTSAAGYQDYQSEEFTVLEGDFISRDIELTETPSIKAKRGWLTFPIILVAGMAGAIIIIAGVLYYIQKKLKFWPV